MPRGDETYIYIVFNRETGQQEHYVSFVPSDFGFSGGLPLEGIMGKLIDGPEFFDAEHFAANPRFLDFFHDVIGRHASNCPAVKAQAKRQHDGHVYLIDARTPTPEDEVPPEDIIGAVGVQEGSVTGYQGNQNYRTFTSNGVMQIDPWFRDRLLEEIKTLLPGG